MIGRILRNISPEQYCLILTENYQNEKDRNTGVLPGKYYVLPQEPRILKWGAGYWPITWLCAFFRGKNIARILKRENCSIVIAASGNLIDIPAGWWASVLTGARFVPYLFDDYLYHWPDERTRSITRKIEERIYRRVKTVIVPNEFLRDEVEKRRNIRAVIVRNPCATPPVKNIQAVRRDYDPQAEIRIVYTGALYHVNFDAFRNLIEATNQLSANIKIHLYTAQPQDWLEYNGIKGEQIVLHPHAVHEEVIRAQSQAHILFLPFAFDSSVPEVIQTSAPGKTAEYLSSGVPILVHAPPNTFVSWYFRKYDCGYVVDTDEVTLLQRAMDELINDPNLRRRLVTNAQERARADFDPLVSSETFLRAMEEML
jgi:glycosyltransferase involved in cell wall biosynthesis